MKFPTIEEMARNVAEKALDEYEYKGKTLRRWIEIILATDNNVGTKHGTNLASLGTDCISRQVAIDAICNACGKIDCDKMDKCEKLQLPPANCSEFPNNSDTISRQAAIDAARDWYEGLICGSFKGLEKRLRALPPAQPEIIRCRECKFASGDSRICMKFDHGPIGELDFCSFAERREVNNESN